MKLNPDELVVTSFEPVDPAGEADQVMATYPCDPTQATRCYICPVRTQDCY